MNDIQSIIDEVFGKNKASFEKAGIYNDEVIISVYDATNEQLINLKNKVNEKYNINIYGDENSNGIINFWLCPNI